MLPLKVDTSDRTFLVRPFVSPSIREIGADQMCDVLQLRSIIGAQANERQSATLTFGLAGTSRIFRMRCCFLSKQLLRLFFYSVGRQTTAP